MNNIFLETKRLILEPLEEKHNSDMYVSWLNDSEVTRYNSHGIFPNTSYKTKNYIDSSNSSMDLIVLAIISKENNQHIGNIAIQNINFINSNAELSIMLGDKDSWGKGLGFEVCSVVIEHCFSKLNLHRVYLGTSSDNIGMQKLAKKLGMSQEGILKENIYRDFYYYDTYIYGLIK